MKDKIKDNKVKFYIGSFIILILILMWVELMEIIYGDIAGKIIALTYFFVAGIILLYTFMVDKLKIIKEKGK